MSEPRSRRKGKNRKPSRPEPLRQEPAKPSVLSSYFSAAAIRETVESIVVALVLAFVFRAFVAEAFVIPTGSMAPTLMGRHRDVLCPQCGFPYQVGASAEADQLNRLTGLQVISGTCPMCRFTMDLGPRNTLRRDDPSYSGDRIMAGRSIYAFGDPRRWDVAVFRYPMGASVNYIKRVAGLPGETLRIQGGDVWVKPDGSDDFDVARKPPQKVLATMQPVYDDDYVLPAVARHGLPMRWAPVEPAGEPGAWNASEDLKTFRSDGTASKEVWLGYRHIVPRFEDWALTAGATSQPLEPAKAELIRDFTAYDTERAWYYGKPGDRQPPPPPPTPLPGGLGQPPDPARLGLNWVGDLVVEFNVHVIGNRGAILVDLVKGGRRFRCRLDVAEGTAQAEIVGVADFKPKATHGIRGPGRHRVRWANVDAQLLLWIDGRSVDFQPAATYDPRQINVSTPNEDDLLPVRIGSQGAAAEVSRLKIFRDIYYIAQPPGDQPDHPGYPTDFDPDKPGYPFAELTAGREADFFSDPRQWSVFSHRRAIEFHLDKDQFFMLGDNSAMSKDSRLWDETRFFVDRDMLIGKALFVYWPHSWNRIPGTPIPFPMFPNFSRMRGIR